MLQDHVDNSSHTRAVLTLHGMTDIKHLTSVRSQQAFSIISNLLRPVLRGDLQWPLHCWLHFFSLLSAYVFALRAVMDQHSCFPLSPLHILSNLRAKRSETGLTSDEWAFYLGFQKTHEKAAGQCKIRCESPVTMKTGSSELGFCNNHSINTMHV